MTQIERQIDRHRSTQLDIDKHSYMQLAIDSWIDGEMNRWLDGSRWLDDQMDGCMGGWTHGCMDRFKQLNRTFGVHASSLCRIRLLNSYSKPIGFGCANMGKTSHNEWSEPY